MTNAEAETVRGALAQLERNGRFSTEDVVTAARDTDSPLHDHFDWDDASAADSFRLEQARKLIRSVQILVTHDRKEISTVCYLHDPSKPPNVAGYVSVIQLKREPENAAAMLAAELGRVDAGLERAEGLAEAFGLAKQVVQTRKRVAKLRESVEQHASA